MGVLSGLDQLRSTGFAALKGKSVAVLCNQSAVGRDFAHLIDMLLPLHQSGFLTITVVFGPEHGLYGHTQDNMIEWEGFRDPRTGLTIHSLYGKHREPTPSMLEGTDVLVVDIPDIGSRYYTFVWTMAHCMNACQKAGIPVMVLDRPNPIGGSQVEGTLLRPGYESFVGLHEVPTRHALSVGELARYLKARYYPQVELEILAIKGWDREAYLDETDAVWVMPSPNMPTVDTAVVYPGMCLLEATNLSEGRGTTRPFEIFGAPFLNGWKLAEALNGLGLPGVVFRPMQFEPTFNKHGGKLCEGCFLHVSDRRAFRPVLTAVAILQQCIVQSGNHDPSELPYDDTFVAASAETRLPGFSWRRPPYEYETGRSPIEILAGNDWLAVAIDELHPLETISGRMQSECDEFRSLCRELAG
jgi:uncharacterized protein YbbC (DUF1343 family)